MKILLKLLPLGILLVALPLIARNDDDRKHYDKCIDKVYVGVTSTTGTSLTVGYGFTLQFTDDKTMIIQSIDTASAVQHTFIGTWKCIGKHCITFCAGESASIVSPVGSGKIPDFSRIIGQICFDDECQTANISGLKQVDFTDPSTQQQTSSTQFKDFTVTRLNCN